MFWWLFGLSVIIWLSAIFFIIKGWGEKESVSPISKKRTDIKGISSRSKPVTVQEVAPKEAEIEVEIPIGSPPESLSQETAQYGDKTVFDKLYNELGRNNIVEFPAEYLGREYVKGIDGSRMSILDFAIDCYRQLDFKCINSVITEEKNGKIFRVNIFDLISDHYSNTEEDFIDFFARLKESLANEVESLSHHPAITSANKRALVGIYNFLPQLVVWNDKELFLVMVKSNYESLSKGEIDFLKEFVIKKRLFNTKLFRVIPKKPR